MITETDCKRLFNKIWLWLRGDLANDDFESWVYGEPALENLLGSRLYLELIATNFRNVGEVEQLRRWMLRFVEEHCANDCRCVRLRDRAILGMVFEYDEYLGTLEVRRQGTGRLWRLSARLCRKCAQWWLVAEEFEVHDNYHLARLSPQEVVDVMEHDIWPSYFDSLAKLLTEARNARIVARFCDLERSTIAWRAKTLAEEEPGIPLSRLGWLLNLCHEEALWVATQVVKKWNVDIDFQGNPRPHPVYTWWNALREKLGQDVSLKRQKKD